MTMTDPQQQGALPPGRKVGGLRWYIVGLIFLATLINYIDRLTISVLGPKITEDLHLSNTQFGAVATWFLLAYTTYTVIAVVALMWVG